MPPEYPLSEAEIQYRKYHPKPKPVIEKKPEPKGVIAEAGINLLRGLGTLVLLIVGVLSLCAIIASTPIAIIGFASLPVGTLLGYVVLIWLFER